MRRSVIAAAASAALLPWLSACGGTESDTASGAGPALVLPSAVATPAAVADPYAWTDVPYGDYLKAAEQLGIRRDLLRPPTGFSAGLAELCRTAPAQLVEIRKAHLANLDNADTFSAAQFMQDEVALRIGLACPQRMVDWTAAGTGEDGATGGSESDGSEAAVTDEDLARATAQEQAEKPSVDPADYDDSADDADRTVDSVGAPTEVETADPSE